MSLLKFVNLIFALNYQFLNRDQRLKNDFLVAKRSDKTTNINTAIKATSQMEIIYGTHMKI